MRQARVLELVEVAEAMLHAQVRLDSANEHSGHGSNMLPC